MTIYKYYVYAYLRASNGTPYYIGKGKASRAYNKHTVYVPKDKSRIVFYHKNLLEEDAKRLEKAYIKLFGRRDIGTGILENKTNGGDGGNYEGFDNSPGNNPMCSPAVVAKRAATMLAKYGKKSVRREEDIARMVETMKEREHLRDRKSAAAKMIETRRNNNDLYMRDHVKLALIEALTKEWTCPHCNVSGRSMSNYTRYHGDNCKSLTKQSTLSEYLPLITVLT